ncbi:MAG: hypothetical protein L6R38_005068 [Xanthoria sp. 2 TBL-2021]|nr:MAG: hypothetical protein L6R38_005068 [Xanthoria sp. 2 TBL-2021]
MAKKTRSGRSPAMDIFYTDDKTHRRIGHITPSPDPAQSRAVNIHLGDTLRLLSSETPSDYCTHSFSSVSEERSLTWQNKDPNANDTGALYGVHNLILFDDTGLQIAVFRPSTRFFGRHTGSLLFSPNLSKDIRDEIVISFLAMRRFTCCCCSFLHACKSPAAQLLVLDYTYDFTIVDPGPRTRNSD